MWGVVVLSAALGMVATVRVAASQAYFSEPVAHKNEAFEGLFAQVAPRVYMAGQPSEKALTQLSDLDVTTVINLRTPQEMDNRDVVPFDEAAVVGALGLEYVHLPLGGPGTPYAPAAVEQLAEALRRAEGKVLLHCTVAWRASHLWAAYLIREHGVASAEAVAISRQLNFGNIPLEGFLGQTLNIEVADERITD